MHNMHVISRFFPCHGFFPVLYDPGAQHFFSSRPNLLRWRLRLPVCSPSAILPVAGAFISSGSTTGKRTKNYTTSLHSPPPTLPTGACRYGSVPSFSANGCQPRRRALHPIFLLRRGHTKRFDSATNRYHLWPLPSFGLPTSHQPFGTKGTARPDHSPPELLTPQTFIFHGSSALSMCNPTPAPPLVAVGTNPSILRKDTQSVSSPNDSWPFKCPIDKN
jgi:hypothetical protein